MATAEAVLVRDLCNHPSNVMTPSRIANEAKKVAKEEALNLKILEQRDMEQLGMERYWGSHEAAMNRRSSSCSNTTALRKRTSVPSSLLARRLRSTRAEFLKPAENMEHMKADMTGGAEVLAAVRAAARLRLPLRSSASSPLRRICLAAEP